MIVSCICLAAALATFGESVKIRGYGEIEASFAPKAARFQCKTLETAEIVYAKLLRDIPGCAAAAPVEPYLVGLKGTTVYVLRVLICALVMACSAAESWSAEGMERFLGGSCRFVESDYIDENAVDVPNRNRDALPLFEEVIRENGWTTNDEQITNPIMQAHDRFTKEIAIRGQAQPPLQCERSKFRGQRSDNGGFLSCQKKTSNSTPLTFILHLHLFPAPIAYDTSRNRMRVFRRRSLVTHFIKCVTDLRDKTAARHSCRFVDKPSPSPAPR